MQTPVLQIETLSGPPITIQDVQFNVRSQVVRLRFPTINGGVIWNRPVVILARTLDGDETIFPIPDVTRTALLTLAGLCFTGMFVFKFLRRKKTES